MTNSLPAIPAADSRLDPRPGGLGQWLTPEERRDLTKPQAARVALERAIGEDSAALPYVQAWLNEIPSDNTRRAYALDALVFVDWLRERHDNPDAPLDLRKVGRKMIAEYAAHLRDHTSARTHRVLSNTTQARRLAALSALYRYMVETEAIDYNPVGPVRRPKVSRDGKTRAVPVEDGNAMLDAARRADPNTRLRDLALLALLFTSGIRITEITRANVNDLTRDPKTGARLLKVTVKGGKEAVRVVDERAAAVLDAYLAGRTVGPLILGNDGGQLNRDQATRVLKRLARAAKVTDPDLLRPHRMRATWITEGLRHADVQDVQEAAGHSDPATTMRYRDQVERLHRQARLTRQVAAEFDLSLPEEDQ